MRIALTRLLIASAILTSSPATAGSPVLRRVTVRLEEGRLDLGIDAPPGFTVLPRVHGEKRMYFEIEPVVAAKEVLGPIAVDECAGLEGLKVAQFDADTVRVVLDFAAARPSLESVAIRGGVVSVPARRVEKAPHAEKAPDRGILDAIVQEVREAYPDVEVEPEPGPADAPKLARSTKVAVSARARSVVAIRKVVIDAGHGGRDRGAVGAGGVLEKDVNLAIAKKLGAELEKQGISVVYTRTTDRFIALSRRARIANASDADLFISIHANAHRSRRINGVETYYLDTSSSRYTQKLARRENGEDSLPDDDPTEVEEERELPEGALGRDLRLMLADLAMRSATAESKRLAGYVQSSLVGSLAKEHGVKDLGVKHALFYVLVGVRMPSVLVESGFLTHASEGKRLASSEYQASVAAAIAKGVRRFVVERQEMASRNELGQQVVAAR